VKFVQRDLGESAENSSGGGSRGLAREVFVLAVLTLSAIGSLYLLTGWLAEFAASRITPQQEQRLFADRAFVDYLAEAPAELETQWEQVRTILNKLCAFEEVPAIEYTLLFDPSRELNAYALPGGGIALTHGLLTELDDEIAMAFVIAHELGHFAGRDHLQGLGRQIGFGVAIQLLMGGSPDALTNSTVQLLQLHYSREQESEADAFALRCLDAVYGRRDGADRLFQILSESEHLPAWAYMFQTHPNSRERIAAIQGAP